MKITVAVCGAFDPFRIGHLIHLKKARALGDELIVIVNSDADLVRKRGHPDLVMQPLGERYQLLKELRCVDEVVIAIDNDGTVAQTLKMLKPDILAKGGDRTAKTMPANELQACKEIGCEIVYGVGDVLSSSSEILTRIRNFKGEIQHKPSGDFK